jgi:hypothetical protein
MSSKREFMEIDLDKVQLPDISPDWQATPHGTTRKELERWAADVKAMQRLREQDGYTEKDLELLADDPDKRRQEIGQTYKRIRSSEHTVNGINLAWDDDRKELMVDRGRHRIWMAKAAGLRHLRVPVEARDSETLDRIRRDCARPDSISRVERDENDKRVRPLWERRGDNRNQRIQERTER